LRAAIYTRVSTADQNPELQLRDLHEYASRQGWEVIETYQDLISGATASRPGLNRLMADAAERKFEILLVWKLNRFGRCLVDGLNNIQELERHRVTVHRRYPGARYGSGRIPPLGFCSTSSGQHWNRVIPDQGKDPRRAAAVSA
jgi:hypothetical protein